MIRYVRGNLLEAQAEALVNTVNEVGVMGKGIALMFREAFPTNTQAYQDAARAGHVRVGRMLVTATHAMVGPRWIINFPTKRHWRHPSQMEWIRDGLVDLVRVLQDSKIRSVALPPLGCGNGGLQWELVRREIEGALSELHDVDILVYEPTPQYYNAPKPAGVVALTPARALIAEMVRRYSFLGIDCSNLEVQKLAWFLQRAALDLGLDDPLRLQFRPNRYGPYADNLRHLLNQLDGSYLHSEKRLGDAGALDLIWFERRMKDTVKSYLESPPAARYLPALARASEVIDGFESPMGMELLATVDWLIRENQCEAEPAAVLAALPQWPGGGESAGRRKQRLFDARLVGLAVDRLREAAFR